MLFLRGFRILSLSRIVLLALLTAVLFPANVHAQVSGGQGAISGRVVDPSGAAVPGAIVTISDTQRGTKRTLRTDGAGYYTAAALEVGTYTVEVKASTFAISRTETINLTVGATLAIDLKLQPESVGTTVDVSTDSDLTRRTDVDNTALIDSAQVEDLPTRGRNFTDFALLTPGISQEQDRYGLVINGQRSSNLYFSIDGVDFTDPLQGGQRGGNNAGVYFFPQVAVLQFELVRTGVPADVGRTNGGFLNVVTKSGTNRYHGEAFYTNRNPYLTWPDPFGDPETNNVQNQFGFAIGGPIRHDRLFFFAGVEKNLLQIPYTVSFTTPAGYCEPAINGAGQVPCVPGDGLIPLPSGIDSQQVNSYGLNSPLASFGRLDYQANPTNRFTLQYTSTFLGGLNFGQTSVVQNTAATNNTVQTQQSQGLTAGWTTVLGANKTNDLRMQYAYDNRLQTPGSPGAEIDIGDLGTIGGYSYGTIVYRAIRAEVIDNFSWLLGKHSLRFGVDMNWEPETQQREADAAGLWTIDTFEHYVEALPVSQGGGGLTPTQVNAGCGGKASSPCIQYDQTLPANGGAELRYTGTQREFAGYIEDSYHIVPRLTINAGFRYEAELEPQPTVTNPALPQTASIPDDVTMYQPRLGLAWDAYGGGHTVVRASVGLLDARLPAYVFARDFTDNGLLNDNLNSIYNPNLLTDVPYLGQLTTVPTGLAIINDVYVNNPVYSRNPRSVQDSLSVTQELTRSTVLTVEFVQNETYDLQHRLDTNLFQPTINAFTRYPVFPKTNPVTGIACKFSGISVPCRPNSTIAGYHQNFGSAHSTYRALQVELVKQLSKHFEGAVNFTWAVARDDDSNERDFNRELALDSLCTACYNKGYSVQDIRNSGNLRGLYRLPFGFTYSNTLQVRTALPWTPTLSGSNADQNNDGNTNNDRPILCGPAHSVCDATGSLPNLVSGRDTFRQPGFINLDMRLIKTFHIHHSQTLEFSAEGLNVTRAANEDFGTNADSKFGKAQATMNPYTGFYYSNNGAGIPTTSPATNRPGGPRQIQLGTRYIF